MNNKKPKNVNNTVTYEEYKNFGKSIDMNECNYVDSYDNFTDESKKAIKTNKKKADIERHHRMIGAILRICELAGYKVESRIVLRDIKTGKIWK